MTYRLIDGEIHKRNSDGHYMPLSQAEAQHVVNAMNALAEIVPLTPVPSTLLSSDGYWPDADTAVDVLGEDSEDEKPPAEYLRDLAERLMHVPVSYGVDGYDVDRLTWIAKDLNQ